MSSNEHDEPLTVEAVRQAVAAGVADSLRPRTIEEGRAIANARIARGLEAGGDPGELPRRRRGKPDDEDGGER